MKLGTIIKQGMIVISVLLLAACAKHHGGAGSAGDDALASQGLGNAFGFGGQEAGESYTTKAPQPQIYLFHYDDATLAAKYLDSVNAQANYLREHPSARILLAGHTDESGSREYNIALGERRANTVAEVIRMAGVNQEQLRVVSYGKERPANLGHDEQSRAQNRRVELTYESK